MRIESPGLCVSCDLNSLTRPRTRLFIDMHFSVLISVLSVLSAVHAFVPLTINVGPNQKQCFFTRAHRECAKMRAAFTVISGGQFDIDASLKRPDGTIIEQVSKSEGEAWLFSASTTGDYELCFYNEMSTVTDKLVQFEFEVDTISFAAEPPKPVDNYGATMEQYITKLEERASSISHQVQYLKVRNTRNMSTVMSTAARIRWFSIIELVAVVGMALFNVTIVQLFFNSSRKNIV